MTTTPLNEAERNEIWNAVELLGCDSWDFLSGLAVAWKYPASSYGITPPPNVDLVYDRDGRRIAEIDTRAMDEKIHEGNRLVLEFVRWALPRLPPKARGMTGAAIRAALGIR